jgi:hypothetical protein
MAELEPKAQAPASAAEEELEEDEDDFEELELRIEDMVFKGKKGDITEPIKRPQGLLILKVEERHEAGNRSVSTLRTFESSPMERASSAFGARSSEVGRTRPNPRKSGMSQLILP